MPSTLYQSVKASIVEYEQIKKHNERAEDKFLFRWKLITIFLAILFILLVGAFSQFLKSLGKLPEELEDYSYIVPLLGDVSPSSVGNLGEVGYLIAGIAAGAKDSKSFLEYDSAEKLFSSVNGVDIAGLLQSIRGQEHLLFLFNTVYNQIQTRFGLYAHKGYTQAKNTTGGEEVTMDQENSRYSTMFNINTGATFVYQQPICNLFQSTGSTLQLFSTLVLDGTGVSFDASNFWCLADKNDTEGSLEEAKKRVVELTGVGSSGLPERMTEFGVEVFKLYLSEQK